MEKRKNTTKKDLVLQIYLRGLRSDIEKEIPKLFELTEGGRKTKEGHEITKKEAILDFVKKQIDKNRWSIIPDKNLKQERMEDFPEWYTDFESKIIKKARKPQAKKAQ